MSAERRAQRAALAAALVFSATAAVSTVFWQVSHHADGSSMAVVDIGLYQEYGERILRGEVPYRDVALEYPPGAILGFLPPAIVTSSYGTYYLVFAVYMAMVGACAVLGLAQVARRTGVGGDGRLALVALLPLALGGVVLTRFDLLPAAVVVLALLLLVQGRERPGFLVLGAAVAIKLYPLVILPVATAWVWKRRGARQAVVRAAEALAVPVLAYAAFAVVALDGVADSIWRQLSRPLQIESLASGVLLALHHAAGVPLSWSSGSGSQNLEGTAADVLAAVSSVVQAAVVAAVWVLFARGAPSTERLVRFAAAAVAAFVAFGKVLSPQYLVWLLLLVPLVAGVRGGRALALLATACALTAIWFPARYWRLVKEFDPLASWLVLPRGLALATLVAVLLLGAGAREGPALRDTARGPA